MSTKLTRYSNTCENIHTANYWTPLTVQVEELDKGTEAVNIIIYKRSNTKVFDTGASSSVGKPGDNFIPTTVKTQKVFNRLGVKKVEETYLCT